MNTPNKKAKIIIGMLGQLSVDTSLKQTEQHRRDEIKK